MNNQTTAERIDTRRTEHKGYAVCTATGSNTGWYYGAYRVVNNGTSTLHYFYDEAFPEPRWEQGLDGSQQLVFEPYGLERCVTEPYDPDEIVMISAERAWLRDLASRRARLARELPW